MLPSFSPLRFWFGVICVLFPLYLYALFSEFWQLAVLVWGILVLVYVTLILVSDW